MSRERDAVPVEVKEKQAEKSPPRDRDRDRERSDRDRSPPPRPRSRSRSGSRGRRSPPRGRSPPPRGRSRSPPPRRRSSRSRSPPRRRRDSRSPPRRGRSRSRSPPRRRSRSPPRRDYGRPNRDRYDSRGGSNQTYTGDWRRTNRERPQAKPSNVLGVFGLAPETDKESLEVIFKKFGKVQNIVLVKDRETGLSKGFCFVYYEDQQDAEDAKAELDGSSVEGRKIRVDFSLTTKPHEPTPGQYMGNKRWDRTRGTGGGFDDGWKSSRDRPRSRSRSRSR